jgi:hypothetical protein
VQVAFDGMVTLKVLDPLWFVVVEVDPAGKPSLSASTGCVGDQTGLSMNAGVHCWADPAAPSVGGSGSDVAVCVELAPCLSEILYQPGWAIVAMTWTGTVCPGWTVVTIPEAVVPVAASFPHGCVFCGDPSDV